MTRTLAGERAARKLLRLERITDVMYALVIWRIFVTLPKLAATESGTPDLLTFIAENMGVFLIDFIALAITIIYWLRSNALLSYLDRTDNRHATLSLLQLFFLLGFVFAIGLGKEIGVSSQTRVFESVAAMLVGFSAWLAWIHASGSGKLVASTLSETDASAIADRSLAEPLAAAITIPVALIGPVFWEIAWLSYIPLLALLGRRRRRLRADRESA